MIQAAKAVRRFVDGGVLYHYQSRYVLVIDPESIDDGDLQLIIALLSEYGEATSADRSGARRIREDRYRRSGRRRFYAVISNRPACIRAHPA